MKKLIFLFLLFIIFGCQHSDEHLQLRNYYLQGQYLKVISESKSLLSNNPDDPLLNMIVGRSYAELGNCNKAKILLTKSCNKSTEKSNSVYAWSLAYLGHCKLIENALDSSVKDLEEVVSLNVTKNSVSFAEKRLGVIRSMKNTALWDKIESKNIIFYFDTLLRKDQQIKFVDQRKKAFLFFQNYFKTDSLDDKTNYFVWSENEKAKSMYNLSLGFSIPELYTIHSSYFQSPGHELCHIFMYNIIKPSTVNRFIDEGIAVYLDQTKEGKMAKAKRYIKDFSSISIKNIWQFPNNYKDEILYPIGGAFMEFLEAQDSMKFRRLLNNQSYKSAEEIYGLSKLDLLISEFEKELKN